MTPQELQAASRIAALMRAARKRKQLTQVAVAKRLQISQSALSKVESALLIPSAPQWFEFCQLTEISPDSLVSGYIEREHPMVPMVLEHSSAEIGFKLPKNYRENRGAKVRAVLPLVMYFRSVAGEAKVEEYFDHIGMDEDILVDRDSQLNLNFELDLLRTMITTGWLKAGDIRKLAEPATLPFVHGSLHREYTGCGHGVGLVEKLVANLGRYSVNFKWEIREQKSNQVDISIAPNDHLKNFSYRNDPVIVDMICQYKQHYLSHFVAYNGGGNANIREHQCHFKGAESCVYSLEI